MSTPLQEKLADEIVINAKRKRPKTKKDVLVAVGYDETTARAMPGRTFEQKGVVEALEARGFSVEKAKEVVGRILDDEEKQDKDRLKAADMVFKVHGAYVPEGPKQEGNTFNFFLNPAVRQATLGYENALKEALALNAPPNEDA